MIHRYIASAIICTLFVSCVSKDTKTVDGLHYVLNNMNQKGDVIYQARLDGFDYRTSLTSAINKDAKSLASLLDYTADGQLMGVGAEEHCEVLFNLLKHWGDSQFATVLQRRSLRVQDHVKGALEYVNPQWRPDQFPETYRLLHSGVKVL